MLKTGTILPDLYMAVLRYFSLLFHVVTVTSFLLHGKRPILN